MTLQGNKHKVKATAEERTSRGERRIRHGKSRKGLWHIAKAIASCVGMTNARFAEPPGADPHAVVVWGGWSETGGVPVFLIRVCLPRDSRGKSVQRTGSEIVGDDSQRANGQAA